MYICKYCGRHYKEKYEVCPNCSGKSFSETAYLGEEIIKTPPKGGYTINYDNFNRKLKSAKRIKLIGLVIALVFLSLSFPFLLFPFIFSFFSEEGKNLMFKGEFVFYPINFLIFITIIIVSFIMSKKKEKEVKQDIEKVKELSKIGILVKGIPFEFVSDGSMVFGKPMGFYIKVTYENAFGVKIPIMSKLTYNASNIQDKKTVDLLIDPNDYNNFYIDYEIY